MGMLMLAHPPRTRAFRLALVCLALMPGAGSAQRLAVTTGLYNWGEFITPVYKHIIFGGVGNEDDVYYKLDVATPVTRRLSVGASLVIVPTYYSRIRCSSTPCEYRNCRVASARRMPSAWL